MLRHLPFLLLLASCEAITDPAMEPRTSRDDQSPMSDPKQLPAFSSGGHGNAVIEIPAGTSDKREYDPATKSYPINTRNGVPRRISFLPYPANYGFIPGTLMDEARGGDGDALDIFVLCPALPTGTILEVEPIGIIRLLDDGEQDDKVIALPVDRSLLTMDVDEISELPKGVEEILSTWLTHYDPMDSARVTGVEGKAAALEAIRKWVVR